MKLEQFNRYEKFLEFEPGRGAAEALVAPDDRPVRGVGDWVNSSFVAVTVANGKISLHINASEFVVENGWPKIRYFHNNNGTTTCAVRDQANTVELNYGSWWLSSEANVPALGVADDEDEDLCAYFISMTKTKERIAHLVQKYSQ
jgi:hypothetical protein